MYSGGVWTDLGTLGGSQSRAYSVSSSGVVFGTSAIAGNTDRHAFMYADGVMTDLNTVLDSTGTGWDLQSAQLTSSGQIIGFGSIGGDYDSFLLTPTPGVGDSGAPEPGSIFLSIGGLGLIVQGIRRLGVGKESSL